MNYYLPKVNISITTESLSYTESSISLHYYINTFPTHTKEDTLFKISKYTPTSVYFFILLEIITRQNIPTNVDLITIGSTGGIEAFEWRKKNTELTSTPYQLIINDSDEIDPTMLTKQVKGGSCIIKLNDTTNIKTIQLLYLFCACYTKVCVCKPTADCSKSLVKYVICTGFIQNINIDYTKITIPYYFFVKINELNSIFGQLQLDNLRSTEPKEKFINWCSEFLIPI